MTGPLIDRDALAQAMGSHDPHLSERERALIYQDADAAIAYLSTALASEALDDVITDCDLEEACPSHGLHLHRAIFGDTE